MKVEMIAMLAAVLSAGTLFAEDELPDDIKNAVPAEAKEETFSTLPFCRKLTGEGEVMKPGSATWAPIEEGKFYPLGSAYRAGANSKLIVDFGRNSTATIENGAAFGTRSQPLGVKSRTVVLLKGALALKLADNLPDGMFFVTSSGFTAKNLAGESLYEYTDVGDGFEAKVRCVTGTMSVEGRHFSIGPMRVADEFKLRSSADDLESILYGVSGDYPMSIDRGIVTREDMDDEGKPVFTTEHAMLDWRLSPMSRVQINRAVLSVGERMGVTVMTFDAAGTLKNHFAFAEGRAEVNSGELVVVSKEDREAMAKQATAAAEETTSAVNIEDDEEEAPKAEEPSAESNEEEEEE